jgi:hypothetical protein
MLNGDTIGQILKRKKETDPTNWRWQAARILLFLPASTQQLRLARFSCLSYPPTTP